MGKIRTEGRESGCDLAEIPDFVRARRALRHSRIGVVVVRSEIFGGFFLVYGFRIGIRLVSVWRSVEREVRHIGRAFGGIGFSGDRRSGQVFQICRIAGIGIVRGDSGVFAPYQLHQFIEHLLRSDVVGCKDCGGGVVAFFQERDQQLFGSDSFAVGFLPHHLRDDRRNLFKAWREGEIADFIGFAISLGIVLFDFPTDLGSGKAKIPENIA